MAMMLIVCLISDLVFHHEIEKDDDKKGRSKLPLLARRLTIPATAVAERCLNHLLHRHQQRSCSIPATSCSSLSPSACSTMPWSDRALVLSDLKVTCF